MARTILLLGLALLLGLNVAWAEGRGKKQRRAAAVPREVLEQIFQDKVSDDDGRLSLVEFIGGETKPKKVQRLQKRFRAKDKDGDGELTLDEFIAPAKAKRQGKPGPAKPRRKGSGATKQGRGRNTNE